MHSLLFALVLAGCTFSPGDVRPSSPTGDGEHGPPNHPADPDDDQDTACLPLGCADLGAECGPGEDGCGGVLDCGGCGGGMGTCQEAACVCAADTMEPNDLPATAHDLGQFVDEDGGNTDVSDLVVKNAADEDWFTFRVEDLAGFTNPDFTVTLAQSAPVHELDVYYRCDAGGDSSTCDGAEIVTGDLGIGCRSTTAAPSVHLHASCATSSETGTAWARVTRASWDAVCQGYSLHVSVNE